jgi:hypothetical protein
LRVLYFSCDFSQKIENCERLDEGRRNLKS